MFGYGFCMVFRVVGSKVVANAFINSAAFCTQSTNSCGIFENNIMVFLECGRGSLFMGH